jgi:hypothetical protein
MPVVTGHVVLGRLLTVVAAAAARRISRSNFSTGSRHSFVAASSSSSLSTSQGRDFHRQSCQPLRNLPSKNQKHQQSNNIKGLPENWGSKKKGNQQQKRPKNLLNLMADAEVILAPLRASVKEQVSLDWHSE